MIPSVWPFALLALAAFRATRLLGWDSFPPFAIARARLLGSFFESVCAACGAGRDDYEPRGDHKGMGLEACPNCSSTDRPTFLEAHRRPLLGELFDCPFCLGWWVSLGFYLLWLAQPTAALVLATPLALSAVVGLTAKNLDA